MGTLFHHRVIDGVRGTGQKGRLAQTDEIQIVMTMRQRVAAAGQYPRLQPFHLRQKTFGLEQKHAAVPIVPARIEIGLRGFPVRLFHKTFDGKNTRRA